MLAESLSQFDYEYEDMIRLIDRLPDEVGSLLSCQFDTHTQLRLLGRIQTVKHLVIQPVEQPDITDDDLAKVLPHCPHLESVVLSGIPDTSDRSVVMLASMLNLQGIDLSGCARVTDVGVLELTSKAPPLQWIHLNGLIGVTDPSVSAIAKSCSRLVELELCDLPLLTPVSVRDLWSFSRKLRTLRLARCPQLTEKAFPVVPPPSSPSSRSGSVLEGSENLYPPSPGTWLDQLPPLVLRHSADNLRVLDLAGCAKLTDGAVAGIVAHAPKLQTLILSRCPLLTDLAVESICDLGENLDILVLSHVSNVTDKSIVSLARSCTNLRHVDLAFCRHLTDMTVFELAGISSLRRLSLVRVNKLTDNAIYFLAEHSTHLEHLHLSYCDKISIDAVHLLMKRLTNLQHLSATGVRSFTRREGVDRFSDLPPLNYPPEQQAVYRVYSGGNVSALRKFLDKEEKRRRDAEEKNIPFVARADDKEDLY